MAFILYLRSHENLVMNISHQFIGLQTFKKVIGSANYLDHRKQIRNRDEYKVILLIHFCSPSLA